ncbi:MAG: hypothetical protein HRT67_12930 [Flavobacteriaceae bacterium]|nr:hypothetical protein [Flavobacteriaceae bacterium]
MKKNLLFFALLGMCLLTNAQSICTQTFELSYQDDGTNVLSINVSDIACNGTGDIIGLQLVNTSGNFTRNDCSTTNDALYRFYLSIDDSLVDKVYASEINGTVITGFTNLTITAPDIDVISDGIALAVDVEVTFISEAQQTMTDFSKSGTSDFSNINK